MELPTCYACCVDVRLQLVQQEAERLQVAGTNLVTILPIMDQVQVVELDSGEKVQRPLSWSDKEGINTIVRKAHEQTDPVQKAAWLGIAAFARHLRPGEGLFGIDGRCGNLQDDGSCGDYENRPNACQQFQVDGELCTEFRRMFARPVPVALTSKPS